MSAPIRVEQALNEAILGLHQQQSNPIERARNAGELIEYLRTKIDGDLATIRRNAVAEATQWPNMSMAKVAAELNLPKSTVARLASPDIRQMVAKDLRTRLANGFNLPPAR
jgi:hypothetical protein